MPTDNPKVSGYVPQAIYDRLIQFKDEQGVSISQAITIVLAEYFGIETEIDAPVPVGGVTLARLEALEKQVSQLFSEQQSTQNLVSGLPTKTLKELTEHFGVGKSTISSARSKLVPEKFLEWTRSQDPEGKGWIYFKAERLYQQEPDSELRGRTLFDTLRDTLGTQQKNC